MLSDEELEAGIKFIRTAVAATEALTPAVADVAIVWDVNLIYGELGVVAIKDVLTTALSSWLPSERSKTFAGSSAAATASSDSGTTPSYLLPHAEPQRRGLCLVDLGSGEGIPLVVAALCFPQEWARCLGVEIVAKHVEKAQRHTAAAAAVPGISEEVRASLRLIEFYCGDFLTPPSDNDWFAAADIVFLNATAYDDHTCRTLWRRVEALRPGAVVIVTTAKLVSPLFELLSESRVAASWGSATCRMYRRRALPRWAAALTGRR